MRVPVRSSVCLLFLLLGLHLYAGPILITDDFSDNVLNSGLWSAAAFGPNSIGEVNQRLELTLTGAGGALAGLRGLVIGNFDLRFDYSLLSSIDSMDPNDDEPAIGALWFFPDSGSFLIRSIGDAPGGGVQGCIGAQLNNTNAGEACYAMTSEQSGSLRLTRVGNIYTAYHWENSDWALLASGASPLTGPADIWLGGGISSAKSMSAAIDNFYLQADGFTPEVPEPSSLALAGIGLALILGNRLRKKAL